MTNRFFTMILINIRYTYFVKTYDLKTFEVENIQIWGATAMILPEIVYLLKRGIEKLKVAIPVPVYKI